MLCQVIIIDHQSSANLQCVACVNVGVWCCRIQRCPPTMTCILQHYLPQRIVFSFGFLVIQLYTCTVRLQAVFLQVDSLKPQNIQLMSVDPVTNAELPLTHMHFKSIIVGGILTSACQSQGMLKALGSAEHAPLNLCYFCCSNIFRHYGHWGVSRRDTICC